MKKLEWFDGENKKTSTAILPFGAIVEISIDENGYRAIIGDIRGVIGRGIETLEKIKFFVQIYVDAEFKRWE